MILIEGIGCIIIILASVAIIPVTPIFSIYVLLVIMGSWIIPLITSYIPHSLRGATILHQTKLFRGGFFSIIAMEHLYHLEHHLYPAVPHKNWPKLAKRLDPYFKEKNIQPIKILF